MFAINIEEFHYVIDVRGGAAQLSCKCPLCGDTIMSSVDTEEAIEYAEDKIKAILARHVFGYAPAKFRYDKPQCRALVGEDICDKYIVGIDGRMWTIERKNKPADDHDYLSLYEVDLDEIRAKQQELSSQLERLSAMERNIELILQGTGVSQ